jgi:hypothetical protein
VIKQEYRDIETEEDEDEDENDVEQSRKNSESLSELSSSGAMPAASAHKNTVSAASQSSLTKQVSRVLYESGDPHTSSSPQEQIIQQIIQAGPMSRFPGNTDVTDSLPLDDDDLLDDDSINTSQVRPTYSSYGLISRKLRHTNLSEGAASISLGPIYHQFERRNPVSEPLPQRKATELAGVFSIPRALQPRLKETSGGGAGSGLDEENLTTAQREKLGFY